jgi:hypothetical protein
MRTPAPDARRRLIALLLARGEIGSAAAGQPGRKRVDEPAEGDVRVDREAEAPARFKRRESVDRAA